MTGFFVEWTGQKGSDSGATEAHRTDLAVLVAQLHRDPTAPVALPTTGLIDIIR